MCVYVCSEQHAVQNGAAKGRKNCVQQEIAEGENMQHTAEASNPFTPRRR